MFKKKDTKEYMKFEDGKIISIEVEQKQKPKPIEPYPQEFKESVSIVDQAKEKAKSFFTLKRLKAMGLILLFICFLLALADIYKVFFITPSGDETSNQITSSTNQNEPLPSLTEKSNGSPTTNTESNAHLTEKPNPPEETAHESIGELLNIANQVNTALVQMTSNEIGYVDQYQHKQANKVALSNTLTNSLAEKENLYITLSDYKTFFAAEHMMDLYNTTENRLLQSVAFTKEITQLLSSDTGSTYSLIQQYSQIDTELATKQQAELIAVLNSNHIPYTINQQLNQVEYTIKKPSL
ncbi:hypothetical protein [Paenibacillus polymyxa]|uniref:Uncharacterized protein n=1 Tax=Paenibacillus polymyxa (strain SC2) TaxID=886882 RepID=E3EK00_PAEPS|nr:hypothetical protein [Paenibacillus polymyxa]ADO60019.1 hypothetical protein PPSC2_28085 [Paenibacillus polymyxa SC2]WPQ59764.1 hypothetical protein SKN87_26100 [Paenibacillus polymyxa]